MNGPWALSERSWNVLIDPGIDMRLVLDHLDGPNRCWRYAISLVTCAFGLE